MKLSTKARYGVMALCDLALVLEKKVDSSGKILDPIPVPLSAVADAQEISLLYLEQIFSALKKANLVESARGAMGGYILARPAEHIRISDIIYALEKPARVTRCENHSKKGCHSSGKRCLTHDLWDDLGLVIHKFLRNVTLHDVIKKKNRSMMNATIVEKGIIHVF